VSTSWPALAQALTEHRDIAEKDRAPAWSPTTFRNGVRAIPTALGTDALAFDLDRGPSASYFEALRSLTQDGLAFVTYTTHSYTPTDPSVRARVVVSTDRTISPQEFRRVWGHVAASRFPGLVDGSTKDVSRLYWLPSAAPGAPRFARAFEGRPLQIDEILRTAPPDDEPEATRPWKAATEHDLREILGSWKGRKWRQSKAALEALIEHQPIAIPGERDNTIYRLVRDLVREAPHLTTESLAQLFAPSLAAMGSDHAYLEEIEKKIDRARDQAIRETPKADTGPALIQLDSTGNVYVKASLTKRYVGPIARVGAVERVAELMGPEIATGALSLVTVDGKAKTIASLVREIGAGVERVDYEYGRQGGGIEGDALVLGCAVPPRIDPAPSLRVDGFLRLLCGHALRDVYSWLVQAIAKPLEPIAALALIGPPGIGKNLFAACVASLWGPNVQATTAEELISDFNENLLYCPLVWADEQLPKDGRGRTTSALLRSSVSAVDLTLNRKHQNKQRIKGSPRWLITVNSLDRLIFQEDLADQDIEAICERVYQIPFPKERAYDIKIYLEKADPAKIVEEFAAHVAWIAEHVQFKKEGRFWIQQADSPLRMHLSLNGWRSLALEWIANYRENPAALESMGRKPLSRMKEGVPWIATRDVLDGWSCYMRHAKCPGIHVVGRALNLVGDLMREREAEGERMRLYRIDLRKLNAWIEMSGFEVEGPKQAQTGAKIIPFPSAKPLTVS
jgi:hypothetical protein